MSKTLSGLKNFKASAAVVVAVTLATMTLEQLRTAFKVTSKPNEDGTVNLRTTLGILPLPTVDGDSSWKNVPAGDAEVYTKEIYAEGLNGVYDQALLETQKKLVASAEKTKATRAAKKASGVADATAEAVEGL